MGKTTAALEVVASLRRNSVNAIYVQEPVRDSQHYFAANFGFDLCLEVFALHLLHESRARFHGSVLIMDRCLLDLVAFLRLKYDSEPELDLVNRIEAFTYAHASTYDFIFNIEANHRPKFVDSFQDIDKLDERNVSDEILRAINESGVSFSSHGRTTVVPEALKTISEILRT